MRRLRLLGMALGVVWVGIGGASSVRAALIGHWTFDNPANPYADSSGFANHGTLAGSGALTQVPGPVGAYSLQFPGGVWLNVGSNDIFDTAQSYTVSAWVYKDPAAGSSWRGAVGDWDGGWMHLGQHLNGVFSNHVLVDGAQKDMIGLTPVKTQQWQHVVSVVDKANKRLQLWVDGALEFSTTLATWGSTNVPGTTNVLIGTPYSSGTFSWIGRIDDVAIWNRALTPSEVQTLYAKGLQGVNAASALQTVPVERGLLLWLDAGDPSTIQTDTNGKVQAWLDKSGNNYHATQSDETRRPLPNPTALNGRPAIRFDGGADGAADALLIDDKLNLSARPYTVFIVDQYYGTPHGRTLQGRDANWLVGKWGGNNGFFADGWVAYTSAGGNNVPAISDAQAYAYGSGYSLNGIDITGTNGSAAPTGNPGKLALNASGWSNEPSKSDVAEVILFNRALSFHERSQVGLYLREKYGLTGYTAYNTHLATKEWVFYGADPGEGLDFQGRFVYAVNVGGSGGIQVGDALFTTDTGLISAEYQISSFTSPNYGTSTNDQNLASVMGSIRWTATDGVGIEDVTITLPGLEIGRTYKLQLLIGDTWTSRHFAVDINGSRVVADLPSAGIQGGLTTQGTVLVHQFVADRNTMTIVLNGQPVSGGDRNPMINAFTLEDLGITGRTTVSTFTGGDPGEGLDFQGAFVYAVNIGGPGGLQIGDARFTADTATPGLKINAENLAPNWSTPNYGSSPNDDVLETLMQSARWTQTSTNPDGARIRGETVSLELTGLTPGQEYVLQLLFGNTGTGRGFDVVINDTLVLDNFSPADYGASDSVGVVVTHRFTAASSLLSIVLDGYPTNFGTPDPVLFALTLEAVPEPGSFVLLLLGALGLAGFIWRKGKK